MDLTGTILSVWAHPDDETYLAGALMAQAIRSGSRVVCVTATRGELGSSDPERWPPGPPLAEVRTRELEKALGELGVTEHVWLDYPDGGCAQADEDEAIARLVGLIDAVRPDTVLTFGPEGMTGHEDHRAVSRWTTAAVEAAGLGLSGLHYATNTPVGLARLRALMMSQEIWDSVSMGAQPPVTPSEELSLFLVADGDLLDAKTRALMHQVSQTGPVLAAMGEAGYRAMIAEEAYRRAGE